MSNNNYEKGYIQVYTGNGKGKTTAAIGLSVRAMGAGMRVFFCQFIKNTPTSEINILEQYPEQIVVKQFGTGSFITEKPSPEDLACAASAWQACTSAVQSGNYDILVMDELNGALALGLLPVETVTELLKNKPKHMEIVITGRGALNEILDAADLVTEMKEIKHYYTKGVKARKGIEE